MENTVLTSDHVVNRSSRRCSTHIVDPNVEHACSRIQCADLLSSTII